MKSSRWVATAVVATVLALCTSPGAALAQLRPAAPRGAAGGGSVVNLPHVINDSVGNQWMFHQAGWMRSQGNQPVYGQSGMITISGNQPQMQNNQARLDGESGELVFDNLPLGPVTLTRRIQVDRDDGYVRYVDILRNPQGQDQTLDVQYQTNVNFGVSAAETVDDPRRKGQSLAWVAQTQGNRAVADVFAGKGSKLAPTIRYQQGNNSVMASLNVTIPGNGEVALMHLHRTSPTLQSARDWTLGLKESQLLRELPSALRRIVANFPGGQQFIGERELLRGDVFDVVELRGGDQVRGTLTDATYQLQTFYGPVELPAARVLGLINVGEFRPRQLLVTIDGEVFGGRLSRDVIPIELTSGQTTNVPLGQVARFGYRKRTGEPEEWVFDKPFVIMRAGDRVAVVPPAGPIDVITRYGKLAIDPAALAAVTFESEDHGVHEVALADGSRFAGLVVAPQFEMKLAGMSGQVVTFPSSGISRLQFLAEPPEPGESDPTLALAGGDRFVGVLAGQLKLDTAFDTLAIEAAEIRRLARPPQAVGLDVQVTLWDDTVISGQLQEALLPCTLKSGLTVTVPVALVETYEQPEPRPSAGMIERINSRVAELDADDWKQRDRAEAELVAMGTAVVPVLKSVRGAQSPEAQQRIDQVLNALSKSKKTTGGGGQAGMVEQ